jgi:hypothetical protein
MFLLAPLARWQQKGNLKYACWNGEKEEIASTDDYGWSHIQGD